MPKWVTRLSNIIIALLVMIFCFSYNVYLGILSVLLIAAFLIYRNLAGVYAYIGNLRYANGDIAGALHWIKRAYDSGKCPPKVQTAYGYLLLKTGEIEQADEVLTDVLQGHLPHNVEMNAKLNKALVLWKQDRLEEAVELTSEVHEEYKNTLVYGNLGFMLILQGDLDKALEYNLEAYEYNDTNPVILDNLGHTRLLRGEWEEAEELYRKLMGLSPKFPEAYYNYGLLLMKKGEWQQALERLQQAQQYKVTATNTITNEDIALKIREVESKLNI